MTTKKQLFKSRNRISGKIGLYIIPRQRSFEIDDMEDLKEISQFLKCNQQK